MRSLPKASRQEEPLSPKEIVTAGLAAFGFVVLSVIFAKVAYAAVALFLHGTTHAVVSLY